MTRYIRLAGITQDSVIDGPGIRTAVFVQGCCHNCPGCHNPKTHNPRGGYRVSVEDVFKQIERNPLINGVTFTGGEPFLQLGPLIELAKLIRAKLPQLNILTYTGYIFEDLLADLQNIEFIRLNDIIIDGPYIHSLKDPKLKFRGSSNQRIIDVSLHFKNNKITQDL